MPSRAPTTRKLRTADPSRPVELNPLRKLLAAASNAPGLDKRVLGWVRLLLSGEMASGGSEAKEK